MTAPNEQAQLFVGQGGGLLIGTNTAHSISLSTNRDVSPTTASIQISGTGTKNVSINAPLAVNSNVSITGSLTMTSFFPIKPFVSLICSGTTLSIMSTGFSQTGISLSKPATGAYTITMPAHPNGTDYQVIVQPRWASAATTSILTGVSVVSSTSFTVLCKTTANGSVDASFFVHTVP